MAHSSSASARSSSTASKAEARIEKKAAKAQKKAEKKERRRQLWQVFKTQVKQDKRLLPYMIGTIVVCAGIVTLFSWLTKMQWWIGLIFGVLIGVMAALIVFARRVQRSVYQQAEGTPGAAAWSLQNNLKGRWRVTPTVAGTTHMDAVHRVIGRPGIVLVGEGAPHRVKPLIAQEKKRIARVVGETPIYDIIVGTGEGEVRLRKLNSHLMKLPRNISTTAVSQLDTKLASLATRSPQVGLPKGPMPTGAKMRSVQRMARRHS
jgi:F0F1-type ATP synthase assembly protein I